MTAKTKMENFLTELANKGEISQTAKEAIWKFAQRLLDELYEEAWQEGYSQAEADNESALDVS